MRLKSGDFHEDYFLLEGIPLLKTRRSPCQDSRQMYAVEDSRLKSDVIHYNILTKIGCKPLVNWWNHSPSEVTHKGKEILFWDKKWPTVRAVTHCKPDMVWIREKVILIVEVGCPLYKNVVQTQERKDTK